MGSMPFDIMMPFYGDFALFREAVGSVRAQTDGEWRLVVIDDVYPSREPGEWAAALGDPRIEVVRNDVNLGVAGNFRRSVDLARSEWMTIMGCDDVMLPDYVARLRAVIERFPEATYIQPGVDVIDGSGRSVLPLADRVKRWYQPTSAHALTLSGEALATSIMRGNWTYFPSICWRRSALVEHPFHQDLEVALDLQLQLELVRDGATLVVDPEITFHYRRHSASVSSWRADDGSRFAEEHLVLARAASWASTRGWKRAARAGHWRLSSRLNALSRIPSAARARDASGARGLLAHALGSARSAR
jgi:glycosyltransferase involved in cell wall biosynthesis